MRLAISLFFVLNLFSCENRPTRIADKEWFDLPSFTTHMVKDMSHRSPKVSKTFMLNNENETRVFDKTDSSFWAKQLAILNEIDLNSPQLKGVITMTKGVQDEKSNLLIDNYMSTSEIELPFKKLSIYYLDDPAEIRKITAELNTDNFIAHSETKIDLWLNRYADMILIDSLQIIGEDVTLMQATRCYQINSKSLW